MGAGKGAGRGVERGGSGCEGKGEGKETGRSSAITAEVVRRVKVRSWMFQNTVHKEPTKSSLPRQVQHSTILYKICTVLYKCSSLSTARG